MHLHADLAYDFHRVFEDQRIVGASNQFRCQGPVSCQQGIYSCIQQFRCELELRNRFDEALSHSQLLIRNLQHQLAVIRAAEQHQQRVVEVLDALDHILA